MLTIIRNKINSETLKQVAEDLKGYIKVVVDVRRKILSAGGSKHVDGEQLLLKDGSRQKDLWGAGLDLETNEIFTVDASDAGFRGRYHALNRRRFEDRTQFFKSIGVDYVDVATDASYVDALVKFFYQRRKRRI